MKVRQIVVITVTAMVFAWSTVLVAVGETAAVAGLRLLLRTLQNRPRVRAGHHAISPWSAR